MTEIDYVSVEVPTDEAPETTHELSCEVCGRELVYSGRGRKPKYCDEHKKSSSGSGTSRKSLGGNERLAAQATEALISIHDLGRLGLRFAGLPETADTILRAEDEFRERAYSALITDPGLCRIILRGGVNSGRVALIIAYGMLASAVVPVAVLEIKIRKEQREKALRESEFDDAVSLGSESA